MKFKAQIRIKDIEGKISSWRDCDRIGMRSTYNEVAKQISKVMLTFTKNGIFEVKVGTGAFQYRVVAADTPSAENDWSVSLNQILNEWLDANDAATVTN